VSGSLFGYLSNVADNSSQDDSIDITFDKDAGLLSTLNAGDFIHVFVAQRNTGVTLSVAQAGGQTWTSKTAISSGSQTGRVFTCQYNGSWSADPAFTTSSRTGVKFSGLLSVWRPSGTPTWAVDVAQTNSNSTPGSPFDVTISGQTATDSGVTIACLMNTDFDGTPMTLQTGVSGTWANVGGEQFRNQSGSGSDQTIAVCYRLNASSGATGSVTKRLDASVTTLYLIETFKDQSVATGKTGMLRGM
jgi:hypothetical protein